MTRHWVVGRLPDAATLLAAVEVLRGDASLRLETFTPHPVEGLDGPKGSSAALAAVGGLGALALGPLSPALAVVAAPALAAVAVAAGWLLKGRGPLPFQPSGYTLAAVTMQGDVAEKTKVRLEMLGLQGVTIVLEVRR